MTFLWGVTGILLPRFCSLARRIGVWLTWSWRSEKGLGDTGCEERRFGCWLEEEALCRVGWFTFSEETCLCFPCR